MRVLLVEDDESIATSLRRGLVRYGQTEIEQHDIARRRLERLRRSGDQVDLVAGRLGHELVTAELTAPGPGHALPWVRLSPHRPAVVIAM